MSASSHADRSRLDDAAAVAFARPDVLVHADDGAVSRLANLAATYYGFWNNGSTALFEATVSANYTDHTLPSGRTASSVGRLMQIPLRLDAPYRSAALVDHQC